MLFYSLIIRQKQIFYLIYFYFFIRLPFPSQHGSGGRIRPPLLTLPNASNYPRPPLPIPNTEKTTKLRPEGNNKANADVQGLTVSSIVNLVDNNSDRSKKGGAELSEESRPSKDFTMTFVPIAAIFVLVLALAMGVWSMRRRFCRDGKKTKQDTVSLLLFLLFCLP